VCERSGGCEQRRGGTRGGKGGCDRLDGGEFRSRLFLALGQHEGLELRYDIIDSGLNCKYRSSQSSLGPIYSSEDVARAAFRATARRGGWCERPRTRERKILLPPIAGGDGLDK
jgi:hypothetical protein